MEAVKKSKVVPVFFAVLVIAFFGAQLVPVEKTNPPVVEDVATPADVKAILRRACYDCHSNETDWPWYASLAPSKFLVARHVEDARGEMNFSEWNRHDTAERKRLLLLSKERILAGEMPEEPYVALHRQARLSAEDRRVLFSWIDDVVGR